MADGNVTFSKLRTIFRFGQLLQHPHMNPVQPCRFEYNKLSHGVSI